MCVICVCVCVCGSVCACMSVKMWVLCPKTKKRRPVGTPTAHMCAFWCCSPPSDMRRNVPLDSPGRHSRPSTVALLCVLPSNNLRCFVSFLFVSSSSCSGKKSKKRYVTLLMVESRSLFCFVFGAASLLLPIVHFAVPVPMPSTLLT